MIPDLNAVIARARADFRSKVAARSLYKTHGALSRAAFQRQRVGLASAEADRLVAAAFERFGEQGMLELEQALARRRMAAKAPTKAASPADKKDEPRKDARRNP